MKKKIRVTTLASLIAMLLLTLMVSGVFAAMPLDLHIEALEFIGTSGEPFTATGSAVTADAVCPAGTTEDVYVSSAYGGGDVLNFQVLKTFTCGDGSGTFDLLLIVQLDLTTSDTTARWRVVGGTGAYTGLKGTGSLVGTAQIPGTSILDVYDGMVH